jgi:hypothetical protein
MACMEEMAWGEPEGVELARVGGAAVDVAGRLRGMWA